MKKLILVSMLVSFLASLRPMYSQESNAKGEVGEGKAGQWESWIEPGMPFFSCVVDARSLHGAQGNLTPRALVFPLGQGVYLAWDVDLLRVAAVWKASGEPFKNASMSVNSYPYILKKVGGGQKALPVPRGDIWYVNGIHPGVRPYPGVLEGNRGTRDFAVPTAMPDPRPPQPNEKEVGRGGLDPRIGRFVGVDTKDGGAIEYEAGGVRCREKFRLTDKGLERQVQIAPHEHTIDLLVCSRKEPSLFEASGAGRINRVGGNLVCRIPPSETTQAVTILFKQDLANSVPPSVSTLRWPGTVLLSQPKPQSGEALNVERIPLPIENPWGRGVRAAAIDFFPDGRLAMVTFDGDVWLAKGLAPESKDITWSRFTSGFHEPQGIRVRDGELFVFDRNGIWRLLDRDKNGEADFHELFCSQIVQTAETREFASAMEVRADGSFLICKPGQNSASNASGTVLHISPDGKTVTEVARGFRQPFLGYDPETGTIGVSDQQGHWVPTTPVIFAQEGAFYGHPGVEADKSRPVSPPLTWIPHQACASSTSLIWMRGTQMGKLEGQPLLVSFNPPKLFQIHTDIDDIVSQGGVTELLAGFDAPLLKAAVNPADGLLYLAGFNIWGTSAKKVSWLGRVRPGKDKTWVVPVFARVGKRGILLSFDTPLGDAATNSATYQVRRWNYRRSEKYGSPNLKLDGTPGTEGLVVASAKVSKDRRSVFIGIPDMREVMQLEVSYDLTAADGTPIKNQTFLTAHLLRKLDLQNLGFPDNEVNLSSTGQPIAKAKVEPTVAKGAILYTQLGCLACHSIDGSMLGKSGPTWKNLYGRKRKIIGSGETIIADAAWLRESILQPAAKVAEGAVTGEAGMPIYEGVLNEEQIESLVLYIQSLSDG